MAKAAKKKDITDIEDETIPEESPYTPPIEVLIKDATIEDVVAEMSEKKFIEYLIDKELSGGHHSEVLIKILKKRLAKLLAE